MSSFRLAAIASHLIAVAALCLTGVVSARAAGIEVPVPRVTVYPGTVIEAAMLGERAFRLSPAAQESTISSREALVGKVARQTLLPGRPITTGSIREPYAVTQGEAALVVFQSGALTITINGLALQSGAVGDAVSVRNVDSGRLIKGTVGADGAVHVGDP